MLHLMTYELINLNRSSSCGRVVKASDSKSDSLWERRFESYQLRNFNNNSRGLGFL